MPAEFRCQVCGAVSHHPEDVKNGYCGVCHAFTGVLGNRVDQAAEAVLSSDPDKGMSLAKALATFFPEAKSGDEAPLDAVRLEMAVKRYIGSWVLLNLNL
jgi:hypothetical protein